MGQQLRPLYCQHPRSIWFLYLEQQGRVWEHTSCLGTWTLGKWIRGCFLSYSMIQDSTAKYDTVLDSLRPHFIRIMVDVGPRIAQTPVAGCLLLSSQLEERRMKDCFRAYVSNELGREREREVKALAIRMPESNLALDAVQKLGSTRLLGY